MLLMSCPSAVTKCGFSQPMDARFSGVASGSMIAALIDASSVSMIRVMVTSPTFQRCITALPHFWSNK